MTNRIEAALVAIGACLIAAGIGWIYPPAGVIAAGVLVIAFVALLEFSMTNRDED